MAQIKAVDKTADEMLYELGYEKFIKFDEGTFYLYRKTVNGIRYDVVFAKDTKRYMVVRKTDNSQTFTLIDLPLHKAIHKKLEDLGWL